MTTVTMAAPLRAITIQAPWTVPILLGAKTVENRVQPTRHRGPVAIHVSRTRSRHALADPRMLVYALVADQPAHRRLRDLALSSGAVVAVAILVDCHSDRGCCREQWGEPETWHLVLACVSPLTCPVPARGMLGVWPVPAPLAQAIAAAGPPTVEGA
jgi:hypothetical protein